MEFHSEARKRKWNKFIHLMKHFASVLPLPLRTRTHIRHGGMAIFFTHKNINRHFKWSRLRRSKTNKVSSFIFFFIRVFMFSISTCLSCSLVWQCRYQSTLISFVIWYRYIQKQNYFSFSYFSIFLRMLL